MRDSKTHEWRDVLTTVRIVRETIEAHALEAGVVRGELEVYRQVEKVIDELIALHQLVAGEAFSTDRREEDSHA